MESESLGAGPAICFHQALQEILIPTKCENPCIREKATLSQARMKHFMGKQYQVPYEGPGLGSGKPELKCKVDHYPGQVLHPAAL